MFNPTKSALAVAGVVIALRATGFVISDKEVWGRPVGLAVGKDGALFLTEDGSGTIWRITHQ